MRSGGAENEEFVREEPEGGHQRSREAGSGTTGQSPHGKEEGGRPLATGVGQEEASQGSLESGKHGDGRGAERTAGNIGWEKDYGELEAAIRMRRRAMS
ncbi:MAG TPA: hypothetical protein VMN36_19380 [Verrucomicrobiales bacterium]|nr:hypothetical protein [Verrucomicrobiales bacterium]